MTNFLPYAGLRVYIMTSQEAERCDRLAYNVKPENGLGWKPYIVRVQSYGACAYKAFHSTADLRRWLGGRFKLAPGAWRHRGFRSFDVVPS